MGTPKVRRGKSRVLDMDALVQATQRPACFWVGLASAFIGVPVYEEDPRPGHAPDQERPFSRTKISAAWFCTLRMRGKDIAKWVGVSHDVLRQWRRQARFRAAIEDARTALVRALSDYAREAFRAYVKFENYAGLERLWNDLPLYDHKTVDGFFAFLDGYKRLPEAERDNVPGEIIADQEVIWRHQYLTSLNREFRKIAQRGARRAMPELVREAWPRAFAEARERGDWAGAQRAFTVMAEAADTLLEQVERRWKLPAVPRGHKGKGQD